MKLELKVLGLLALIMLLGLTTLNSFNVFFLSKFAEGKLKNEAIAIYLLGKKIPNYVIVSDNLIGSDDYILVTFINNKFVFIKKSAIFKEVLNVLVFLIVIELTIMVFSLVLLNKVLNMYAKRKENYIRIIRLIALAISHKFGNTLSTFGVNIDILEKDFTNKRIIDRLKVQYSALRESLNLLVNFLSLATYEHDIFQSRKINLKSVIYDVQWNLYDDYKNKDINIYGGDFIINASPDLIKFAVSILIENALKYSKSYVRIKICRKGVVIANDIGYSKGGMGIGILIAENILNSYNLRLLKRSKHGRYITLIHENFT